jgi:hypothetical protein
MTNETPKPEATQPTPSAEILLSFLQEMSNANTMSLPATANYTHSFISYGLPVPETRKIEIGYDHMAVYVKSPSTSDYKAAIKSPNRVLANITFSNFNDFPEMQGFITPSVAAQYRIVPKSRDGDLTIVKQPIEQPEEPSDTATPEDDSRAKRSRRRFSLGRVSVSKAQAAESQTEYAPAKLDWPEAEPSEISKLFQLLHQSVIERDSQEDARARATYPPEEE